MFSGAPCLVFSVFSTRYSLAPPKTTQVPARVPAPRAFPGVPGERVGRLRGSGEGERGEKGEGECAHGGCVRGEVATGRPPWGCSAGNDAAPRWRRARTSAAGPGPTAAPRPAGGPPPRPAGARRR